MKTIKIIDLFTKIARDEDVPKKIKYDYKEYIEHNKVYEDLDGNLLLPVIRYTYQLNSEAEIIEEKKLPKKIRDDNAIWEEQARDIDYDFKNTINQLIDYLESKEKGE